MTRPPFEYNNVSLIDTCRRNANKEITTKGIPDGEWELKVISKADLDYLSKRQGTRVAPLQHAVNTSARLNPLHDQHCEQIQVLFLKTQKQNITPKTIPHGNDDIAIAEEVTKDS